MQSADRINLTVVHKAKVVGGLIKVLRSISEHVHVIVAVHINRVIRARLDIDVCRRDLTNEQVVLACINYLIIADEVGRNVVTIGTILVVVHFEVVVTVVRIEVVDEFNHRGVGDRGDRSRGIIRGLNWCGNRCRSGGCEVFPVVFNEVVAKTSKFGIKIPAEIENCG